MNAILANLLNSAGLKRYISSALTAIATIIAAVPGLSPYFVGIQNVAAAFGIVGVAHAIPAGTLGANVLSTITSGVGILLAASSYVPALAPYAHTIQSIAMILGISTTARGITIAK